MTLLDSFPGFMWAFGTGITLMGALITSIVAFMDEPSSFSLRILLVSIAVMLLAWAWPVAVVVLFGTLALHGLMHCVNWFQFLRATRIRDL